MNLVGKEVDMVRLFVRTVMITGDNPLTAAAIAAEAGVDDFLAEATPEDKMEYQLGEDPVWREALLEWLREVSAELP